MLEIAQNDNGRELTLAMGEVAELSLSENRTTGYLWDLNQAADAVCELVKDEFEAAKGPPGSGGMHRWRFEAIKPGSGEIELAVSASVGGRGGAGAYLPGECQGSQVIAVSCSCHPERAHFLKLSSRAEKSCRAGPNVVEGAAFVGTAG